MSLEQSISIWEMNTMHLNPLRWEIGGRGGGHHFVHAVLHGLDLLGGDPHLAGDAVQHIIDGQACLAGAAHTQPLGGSLSVFHFRDEYHSDALVASCAHDHIYHKSGFPDELLYSGSGEQKSSLFISYHVSGRLSRGKGRAAGEF